MRLLITGGLGFIGSALIRHLLRGGEQEIINVDKLTYAASPESLNEVLPAPNYRFERADIADADAMSAVFARHEPDAVLHLAAESHVDRSIDGPAEFVRTNITGTYVLLEAARGYWESLPKARRSRFRFHHVSTDEVFGSLGQVGHFTEATPYAPSSPYSASKASSDFLVRAWHHTYGLPVVTTNCSNNYGPYQYPEKLIPVVVLAALEGRAIPVYGKGANVRDWLFVEDHAQALLTVLERGALGETYAIGGRAESSNLDLVTRICAILDELLPDSSKRPHAKLISFVQDRPGHDLRYAIDPAKIERELGWRPTISLDQGLRRTVAWYLANRWWWETIRARGQVDRRLGLALRTPTKANAP